MKNSVISFLILYCFCFLGLSALWATEQCWNTPTLTGNFKYPAGWPPEFQWDPANPEEIDRESFLLVAVIHGSPPYTWTVNEENGFSLEHGETSDFANILYADDTACGTATITVVDEKGERVEGYIRCTSSGTWVVKGSWTAAIPRSGYAWDCQCGQYWDMTGCHWEEVWCQGQCCCLAGREGWCYLQHCCDYPLNAINFYTLGTTGEIVWGTYVDTVFEKDNLTVVENPNYANCNNSPSDWSWPSEAVVDGYAPPCSPGGCGQIIGSDCVRGDSPDIGKPIAVKRIWAFKYECP